MNRLASIFSEASARFEQGLDAEGIDWLAHELGDSFDTASSNGDLDTFRTYCRSHPLSEVFLTDPYSRRALDKPRGYAGDAVMLDYIYRPDSSNLQGLAKTIHHATTTLPNAKSILWRQEYLANLIHNRMYREDEPEVLSIASGHMRELDILRQLTKSTSVRFTAIDQDKVSLSTARLDYSEFAIDGMVGKISSFIRSKSYLNKFDLVYSAGLFDYLSDQMSIKLLQAMFSSLKPGGVLSIANFSRDSHGRGFMAAFMDWCLVYRNEDNMRTLADAAFPKASIRMFRDSPRNVVYLEVYKDT